MERGNICLSLEQKYEAKKTYGDDRFKSHKS